MTDLLSHSGASKPTPYVEQPFAGGITLMVPKITAPILLGLLISFVAALLFWILFSDLYDQVLSAVVERLIRLGERPAATHLISSANNVLVDRVDFPKESPRPELPVGEVTANFLILVPLLAVSASRFPGYLVIRLALAFIGLFAIHVFALAFWIESLYAMQMGPWSRTHYGPLATSFWTIGYHFYQILGRYAAPVGLWCLVTVRVSNTQAIRRHTRAERHRLRRGQHR